MKHPVIAAIVLGILVSGCQRKAEGQTVAVVNGKEITLPQLNFALDQAKAPENADKNAVRSQVLQQLVDRQLLVEQARSEGIDKTPEYLNRQRQADDQLLITMLAARRLNTAQLPSDREVDAFIAGHPGMFANRETWSLDRWGSTPSCFVRHYVRTCLHSWAETKSTSYRERQTANGRFTITMLFVNATIALPHSFRFSNTLSSCHLVSASVQWIS